MNAKSFGRQLSIEMEKHGMSDSGLASLVGVTADELTRWKNGTETPSLEKAADIANALGIPLDNLTAYRPEVTLSSIDDEYSKEEKREMAEKISAENEKKLKQAKMLVALVIILEVISTSLLNLVSLNFISIIVNVVFFILLWNGIPWVRYYYIYWAFSTVIVLIATTLFSDIVFPNILLVLIPCIIRLAGGLIFTFNSSVKDFLYGQYAG